MLEKRPEAAGPRLNMFLRDIYHGREILRAGIDPGRPDLPEPGVPARR